MSDEVRPQDVPEGAVTPDKLVVGDDVAREDESEESEENEEDAT